MKSGSTRLRTLLVVALGVAASVAVAAPLAASTPRAATPTEVTIVAGVNDPNDPNIAVLEFLPEKAKIAKGTTVTWEIAGPEPHSVTFVAPGTDVPPSVEKDPSLFGPTPPTGDYDGSSFVSSGVLPLGETSEVQKFSMSFGTTGTYTYYCVLHPNMVGSLTVTDDTGDSQQKITKAGNQQKAKYLKEGEAAKAKLLKAKPKSTKNSDGTTTHTIEMGVSTKHTDVLAFAPAPQKVKAGDQVTFVNNSAAPHTASFGGALVPLDPLADDVVNPVPGPSPQTLAPNTYLNTGWLPPKSKQGPPLEARSYTYTVPDAGKYEYACVLHLPSGMAAVIEAS